MSCLPPQLTTPLMISLVVVAVTRGGQAGAGWGGRCLVSGASQDLVRVSQGLTQVNTSQQIMLRSLETFLKFDCFFYCLQVLPHLETWAEASPPSLLHPSAVGEEGWAASDLCRHPPSSSTAEKLLQNGTKLLQQAVYSQPYQKHDGDGR